MASLVQADDSWSVAGRGASSVYNPFLQFISIQFLWHASFPARMHSTNSRWTYAVLKEGTNKIRFSLITETASNCVRDLDTDMHRLVLHSYDYKLSKKNFQARISEQELIFEMMTAFMKNFKKTIGSSRNGNMFLRRTNINLLLNSTNGSIVVSRSVRKMAKISPIHLVKLAIRSAALFRCSDRELYLSSTILATTCV